MDRLRPAPSRCAAWAQGAGRGPSPTHSGVFDGEGPSRGPPVCLARRAQNVGPGASRGEGAEGTGKTTPPRQAEGSRVCYSLDSGAPRHGWGAGSGSRNENGGHRGLILRVSRSEEGGFPGSNTAQLRTRALSPPPLKPAQ